MNAITTDSVLFIWLAYAAATVAALMVIVARNWLDVVLGGVLVIVFALLLTPIAATHPPTYATLRGTVR